MKKGPAGTVAAAVLILLTMVNTYFILKAKDENAQRAAETRAIAINNCNNIAALARTERAFIERQEAQSRGLIEHGVTFGIPPSELSKIVRASKASQARFLGELDALTLRNCAAGASEHAAVVIPKQSARKGPKAGGQVSHSTGGIPSAGTAPAALAGGSPRARANPLPSRRTVTRTITVPAVTIPAATQTVTASVPTPPILPLPRREPPRREPPLNVPPVPRLPCVPTVLSIC